MVGGPTLLSWDDTSREAGLFKAIYYSTMRTRLSGYPWKFALRTAVLTQRPVSLHAPQSGYKYVFVVPDFIAGVQVKMLRAIGLISPYKASYALFGDELHTDSINTTTNDVHLLYIGEVDSAMFSDAFAHSLELELAAKFAMSVKEDINTYKIYEQQARLERKLARNHDAKSAPLESLSSNIRGLLARMPSTRV